MVSLYESQAVENRVDPKHRTYVGTFPTREEAMHRWLYACAESGNEVGEAPELEGDIQGQGEGTAYWIDNGEVVYPVVVWIEKAK